MTTGPSFKGLRPATVAMTTGPSLTGLRAGIESYVCENKHLRRIRH
jgi:hypothetical protein